MKTSSIFIGADVEQIAKSVIMPGDPKRADFIAHTYLEDPQLVSDIRGIPVYTGEYHGRQVTVMASGMGVPSMGIYSHDLYQYFGVERIIRCGTAGGIDPDLHIRDLVLGEGACTVSSFAYQFRLPGTFAPIASFPLLRSAVDKIEKKGLRYKVGNLFCTDYFYDDAASLAEWQKVGVLAVEMESAGLYTNAARFGKQALTICTISDCPLRAESSTPEETERTFTAMMEIALEVACEE